MKSQTTRPKSSASMQIDSAFEELSRSYPAIRIERSRLFDQIRDSNFTHLNSQFLDYYQERTNHPSGAVSPGEYVPAILADLLDIEQHHVNALARPWIICYSWTLLTDDLIDRGYQKTWVLWKTELLRMLGQELSREFDTPIDIWTRLKSDLEDMIGSMQRENPESRYDAISIDPKHILSPTEQGKKAAPSKSFAHMLLALSGDRSLSSEQELAIDYLSSAVQIGDDITDLTEDYHAGRKSCPLSLARESFPQKFDRIESATEAVTLCRHSGALLTCSVAGERYIQTGLDLLNADPGSPSYRLLIELAESFRSLTEHLKSDLNGRNLSTGLSSDEQADQLPPWFPVVVN